MHLLAISAAFFVSLATANFASAQALAQREIPLSSQRPVSYEPVGPSVQDYLHISKLSEVHPIFYKACYAQFRYFHEREAETGVGEFLPLAKTSFFIPGVFPIEVTPPEIWTTLGILEAGSKLYFQFEVVAEGSGTHAVFEIRAVGDLNGDGVLSLLTMPGIVSPTTGYPTCLEAGGENPLE